MILCALEAHICAEGANFCAYQAFLCAEGYFLIRLWFVKICQLRHQSSLFSKEICLKPALPGHFRLFCAEQSEKCAEFMILCALEANICAEGANFCAFQAFLCAEGYFLIRLGFVKICQLRHQSSLFSKEICLKPALPGHFRLFCAEQSEKCAEFMILCALEAYICAEGANFCAFQAFLCAEGSKKAVEKFSTTFVHC